MAAPDTSIQSRCTVVVDLTRHAQACFNCKAILNDGPKYRIHGFLLCDGCADVVSLLRAHNWRMCLVCAAAGEGEGLDCIDIQEFLERPDIFVKQFDWMQCPVCEETDDLLYTPCGHVCCLICWEQWEAERGSRGLRRALCPVCRTVILMAPVVARSKYLYEEWLVVESTEGSV